MFRTDYTSRERPKSAIYLETSMFASGTSMEGKPTMTLSTKWTVNRRYPRRNEHAFDHHPLWKKERQTTGVKSKVELKGNIKCHAIESQKAISGIKS